VQAGKLRQVVNILSHDGTAANDLGGLSGWTTFASNVRCSITALQGRELYKAQQMVGEVTHQIKMRWLAGVNSDMSMQFAGPDGTENRYFKIQSVSNPDERTKELHLLCIERDAGQLDV
jgi:SPP1 family predicted phage head-tail adaptor